MRTVWLSSRLDWRSHLENSIRVFSVEVAGRLVGEDDSRTVDESAGYRLHAAARRQIARWGEWSRRPSYAEHIGEVSEEWAVEFALGGRTEVGDVMSDLDIAHG